MGLAKTLLHSKGNGQKSEQSLGKLEKIFANYLFNKWLILSLYKQFKIFKNEEAPNALTKSGKGSRQIIPQKEKYKSSTNV